MAADVFREAQAQHQSGNLGQAIRHYKAILEHEPNHTAALHFLGLAQLQNGEKEGKIHLEKALALAPDNTQYRVNSANMLAQFGDRAEAEKLLHTVLEKQPNTLLALEGLGLIHYRAQQFEEAFHYFEKAAKIDENRVRSLEMAGVCLFRRMKFKESSHWFERVLRLKPDHAGALMHLAMMAMGNHDMETAARYLIKAEETRPNDPAVLRELARALIETGFHSAAETRLKKILVVKPDDTSAYALLSKSAYDRKEVRQAESWAKQALEKEPDNADLWVLLGNISALAGEDGRATEHYQKALALEPDNIWAYHSTAQNCPESLSDAHLRRMEALSTAATTSESEAAEMFYGMARAYESRAENAKAWGYYQQGAGKMQALLKEQTAAELQRVEGLAALSATFPKVPVPEGALKPLFLIGMPRSGSALLEGVLSAHGNIFASGGHASFENALRHVLGAPLTHANLQRFEDGALLKEAADLYRQSVQNRVRSQKIKAFTDCYEGNVVYLPLLRAAFPDAVMVHCHRDPITTAQACFKYLFARGHSFTYSFDDIAKMMALQLRIIEQEKPALGTALSEVLDIDLINTPEPVLKRVLASAGLAFDEACVRYLENRHTQALEGPYRDASAQVTVLGDEMTPLMEALARHGIPLVTGG